MFAFQFERSQVVVECGGCPCLHGVTLQTVRAEATLVRLIITVTGNAILRRGFQIQQLARVGMAAITIHLLVRTCQRKGDFAMIKVCVVSIHAIVTSQAIPAPTQDMCLRKCQVHIKVAVLANN